MTFKESFPPVAHEYIKQHMDEWPSVLAFKIGRLFGHICTERGVREQIKKIRREQADGIVLRG